MQPLITVITEEQYMAVQSLPCDPNLSGPGRQAVSLPLSLFVTNAHYLQSFFEANVYLVKF